MFFKLSAPHVSFREYLFEGNLITKPLVLLIACVVKLFRIPIPGSTDIPAVASLSPFRVAAEKVDPEILKAITAMDLQLHEMGFCRIDLIGINDLLHSTRYGGGVYRSQEGDTVAWVRYRLWPQLERKNKFTRLALYSLGQQGEIILTTAANRDLLDPPHWHVQYHPKVDAERLRDLHQMHIRSVLGSARAMTAPDLESAFDLLEHTHDDFVDFQLERGVFVQQQPAITPAKATASIETAALVVEDSAEGAPAETSDETSPIIAAVRKQETKQSGWLTKLLILAVSVAFFVLLGAWQWELEFVLILVGILFVHELGHYVAMKAFGYKNIHMFFIPLLGAAVSGRNYRVSGWKKAIVSLAGPLPSIALGLVLGGIGVWLNNEWCVKGSLIMLILNVLNLAPFLPLDGGQVAHVTLFSRSNVVDLIFRIGTSAILMLVATLLQAKILFGLGIAMIIGLPSVWNTMKVTDSIRNLNLPPPSEDHMPVEAIHAVVDAIQRAKLPTQGIAALAKSTLTVYETVIIRPPNWPATIGIWALYFGGLMSGVIGLLAISLAGLDPFQFDDLPEFNSHFEQVETNDGQFRMGKPTNPPPLGKHDLLMWRFDNPAIAADAFKQLTDQSDDTVSRLGNVVFTSRRTAMNVGLEEIHKTGTDDWAEQLAAADQLAINDPRLNAVDGARWQRAFLQGPPSLIIVVPQQQADTILAATANVPQSIADHFPIAPWTPKVQLTDSQQQLQTKLCILQGNGDETPWADANEESDEEPLQSTEEFRDKIRRSADRFERMQQQRENWIRERAQNAPDTEGRLFTAYADFDIDLKAWQKQPGPANKKPPPPQLDDYLQPLLSELGYLDHDHPLAATGVTVEAYELDPDAESESILENFPIDLDGNTVLLLHLYPARDAAAAYACVHAWLKGLDIKTVYWNYETVKSEE